jgi:hypothetical protein
MKSSLIQKITCASLAAAALCGSSSSVQASDAYATAVQALNPIIYYQFGEAPTVVPTYVATNLGSAGAIANGVYLGDNTIFTEPFLPGAIVGDPTDAAISFTGSGSPYPMGVSIPWSTNINPAPAFSCECWANPPTDSGTALAPFASINGSESGYYGTGRGGWTIYENGANWVFKGGDAGGYTFAPQDTIGVILGAWTHIVGVIDGTNAYLYENGVLQAQAALSRPFVGNTGQNMDIGYSSSFGRNFNGGVDECAIYPYALSASQIAAHYAAGISPSPGTPYKQVILNDHPVGYWRLDDGAFTAPPTNTYPSAVNIGTLGTNANGLYLPGTQVGAPGLSYPGFGSDTNATYFNGVMSGIEIPPIPVQTDSMTFTAWIMSTDPMQADPGDPGYASLFCQGSYNNNNDPVFVGYGWNGSGYAGQVINTLWFEGTTNPAAVSDYTLQPSPLVLPTAFTWNFVAAVWNPTNTTIYFNGQPSPITGSGPHSAHDFSQAPLWLAASDDMPSSGGFIADANGPAYGPGNCDWLYEGYMAHPAIFASALTADQIQGLYAAAQPLPQVTSITQSPAAPNYVGQTITLSATAFGPGTLSYQWLKNGSPQSGRTSVSNVLSSVTTGDSGAYAIVVNNANGSVTSAPITIAVTVTAPIIVTQPQSAGRYTGRPATFSVAAIGNTPISYAWSLNSTPISGATNSSYTAVAGPSTGGTYGVTLANSIGSTIGSNAVFTVIPTPSGYAGAVLAAGPDAYWRFNETNGPTAHDFVNGNDGTIFGSLTNGIPGPTFPGLEADNTSFAFDGNAALTGNSIVKVPPMPVNSNTVSVIALAMRSTNVANLNGYACILQNTRLVNDDAFLCADSTGQDLTYDWNDNTNGAIADFDPGSGGTGTNFVFTPGTWCFVGESISATNAVLFMDNGDGHLDVVSNYTGLNGLPLTNAVLALTGAISLGGDQNLNSGNDRTWNGGLDEIAYWKRTLTTDEITAIHTALVTKATSTITLSAAISGGNIQISFAGGTLQSTTNLSAGFTNVTGSPTSPYTPPTTSPAQFFRVKQ